MVLVNWNKFHKEKFHNKSPFNILKINTTTGRSFEFFRSSPRLITSPPRFPPLWLIPSSNNRKITRVRVRVCRVLLSIIRISTSFHFVLERGKASWQGKRRSRREVCAVLCTLAYRFLLYWARSFERDNTHTTIIPHIPSFPVGQCEIHRTLCTHHRLLQLRPLLARCRVVTRCSSSYLLQYLSTSALFIVDDDT